MATTTQAVREAEAPSSLPGGNRAVASPAGQQSRRLCSRRQAGFAAITTLLVTRSYSRGMTA